jgi:hypothetical protein
VRRTGLGGVTPVWGTVKRLSAWGAVKRLPADADAIGATEGATPDVGEAPAAQETPLGQDIVEAGGGSAPSSGFKSVHRTESKVQEPTW